MANWKEYTTKTAVEDTDELMIADATANANKRTPLSILWNWIAGKLATAVISQLETQNKSIIPALNELNSKSFLKAKVLAQMLHIRPNSKIIRLVLYFSMRAIQIKYLILFLPFQPKVMLLDAR